MKGVFITFDGGEGCGKTTQLKKLREALPGLYPNREFVLTREPGGSPFAEEIRNLILGKHGHEADGKTMFGLFAAARADHLQRTIIPNLEKGGVVISDRFAAATYAYQAYAMQNPISTTLFKQYYEELDRVPDLTIILDVDPLLSQERVRTRAGEAATHFDTRPLEFHQKLRQGYLALPDLNLPKTRFVYVDASASIEMMHADILEHIRERLG